ncbi:MAG: SDR family NAD(P)-dependent oxidoreductase [Rhodobacteraceae bacterium]|nr:SDR family NAD(P)-dependent oxidoreductase [Alphaproteobacteria bacterium]MBT8475596.1 SDR family NAD(P)-dependent oxidoreductase [Alphaproteobacteria bacterium]NNF71021.1 SDR family NAD(P)-dependent oxidoreductase [Paracoccaceae bacterium]NNK67070.1 SDR family NAD(P)-dependent oxidoreductase [Paracoccaceae bacterium]
MSQTLLITGASSGIGRATAEAAIAAGWRVGLFARRREPLEELAENGDCLVLPGDVTDPASLEMAVASMADTWGRLDVLFNNAGIFPPQGMIDEIDVADWNASVSVNLTGMFNAARAAFAQMRRQAPQGGRIINNGSISAYVPRPGSVAYTATKHAITGLTKSLSLDGRPFDIACGQIDIGNAKTPILEALAERAAVTGDSVPAMMDVEDAARSVLHMASMPPGANVQFMTVMATKMPYIGRG